MVTREASWSYRDAHDGFARTYFRSYGGAVVSSIGLGTYLGEPTDDEDAAYESTVRAALEGGVNVLDTAINYRHQRSERAVGRALADSEVDREAVLVATKGGFLPFDGERPADPGRYVREEYVETALVGRDSLARGSHCIAPDFLDDQLDRSLANLGVETVDLYYVHNPETQLAERSQEAVYDQLEAAFERLEERVASGDIRAYGVATWDCFRVPPDHPKHLSLAEVVRRARAASDAAGRETTGLRAVQLPFNVRMADAYTVDAHEGPEGRVSALEFASEAGLSVFTSASIGQGELAAPDAIPNAVDAKLAGDTPAQRALNFARSAPGVTCSLVGTRDPEHLAENVAAGRFEPMGARAFDATFE